MTSAQAAAGYAAGRDQASDRAHAVPRPAADGPPPWVAACGTPVAVVQGSWAGRRGLGSADPCPRCRAISPA
ncbi:hypothetical protein [Geodermatophilus dictyosporus]|uniref:hypothetical protein n=1 Tax=Geodermatophilus dictyosporus TaxID=1523247 RepID=UPI000B843B37|nr:hypothetical protein [Geodermatophilus dictyosporus]